MKIMVKMITSCDTNNITAHKGHLRVFVMYFCASLTCHGVICALCACLSCLILSWACWFSTLTSARVLVGAPIDESSSQRNDTEDHAGEVRALTLPLASLPPHVSSPKRLSCRHGLAHAARHGHIMVASTSKRFCLPLLTAVWQHIYDNLALDTVVIVVFDLARV